MPGLVEESEYTLAKARLCAADASAVDVLDAIEWVLMHSADLDSFRIVAERDGVAVRQVHFPRRATTPGIVMAFTRELTGGESKVVLLEAWLADDEPAEES